MLYLDLLVWCIFFLAPIIHFFDPIIQFLSNTKERLHKMQEVGGKGAKKPYYIMMKKRAAELNDSSMKFLAFTDVLKNNLAAIPTKMPDDKNHVDR